MYKRLLNSFSKFAVDTQTTLTTTGDLPCYRSSVSDALCTDNVPHS